MESNHFGIYWQYTTKPKIDPKDKHTLDVLCTSPNLAVTSLPDNDAPVSGILCRLGQGISRRVQDIEDFFSPFLNVTHFWLMN